MKPDLTKRLGPDFKFENQYAPDAQKILPHMSKWLEIWNNVFVK
jgi:hypothetical protein